MNARPILVLVALAAAIGGAALLVEANLPASRLLACLAGACAVLVATRVLLADLPGVQRRALVGSSAFLGFFVAFAASRALGHPWPAAIAGAFVPATLLFLAGFGRERDVLELARLEGELDDPKLRAAARERAKTIRDARLERAQAIDPSKAKTPERPNDARALHAYAAQIVAYADALDGRFGDAARGLGAVPVAWMPSSMRLLMLSNLAFWSLCAGDLATAEAALSKANEKEGLPEARPNLRATRALALVLADRPDGALAIVGEEAGNEPERLAPRYALIRAHAFAAKGDVAKARAQIERALDGALGADEAGRILQAGGPAKALVEHALRAAA